AGPASIIAWVALLGLSAIFATVFAALGRKVPGAAGAAGYAAAGLGRLAATMTRWWFLAGVIAGAPIVCLIGASYVTALTGGGPLARAGVAAGLLLVVLGLALGGVRASTMAQLLLVALLIAVVVTAVAGSAPAARPAPAGHRAGRAGGGRRGRAGPGGRLGQRLHLGGERDAARADRRTQSEGAERVWPGAPPFRSRPAWHHRPGRPGADRPVRAA